MKLSHSWQAYSHSASQETPRLYATRSFIIVFTRARNSELPWARI